MTPKPQRPERLRSGLIRLCTWFRCHVCRRDIVVHVLTHLILNSLLRTVLLSHGVPEWLTDLLILFIATIVAHATNDHLDSRKGKQAEG